MKKALQLAEKAQREGEIPVGALIVCENEVIAEAYNQKEGLNRCTGHAELLAIERASSLRNNWRLSDCDLYVTLEPCLMCLGAVFSARCRKLIYGARDPRAGAVSSVYPPTSPRLYEIIVWR